MSDSKYFSTTKKGEIFELKSELASVSKDKKRDALKKVIASMTVGKDVSDLFMDVNNCGQTDNLELKKLVYLYIMNYAKTRPDKAIMAVSTFDKDCTDPNPLIRALAVRTMGCIRVEEITEYLCGPLRRCLRDEDPYVRKTAAVAVAKLFDINANLVKDQGFLDALRDLLSDSNPMVVANAVAALSEINESSPDGQPLIELNAQTINKLLTALNECSEWGQVFILDALSNYVPKDEREAQSICERITPRLAHANAAVVLSCTRVLLKYLEMMSGDTDFVTSIQKKLSPPLVTLLASEPEVQYVALRNINLIIQKRPDILKHEMKVFFVKYNDPIYVKLEKLDIMIRLASQSNIAQVLSELKEYATEVDVDFVRKSVRAIGRCAIKIEASAERCVSTLLDLIQTKVNYVVQEAIVVIKDIFRKYPNKYESIIGTLCENLDTLDEPEARASMVWVIGEYAERIDNADELLENFLDTFHDENAQVQLQVLTAIVKLFLKKPSDTQDLVQQVLSLATQDSDNPDLRDRGFIYWRLLSTDPAAAKEVVLAEKPIISVESDQLEPELLDELICHISSLASVFHKPPSTFVEGAPTKRVSTLRDEYEFMASDSVEEQQPQTVAENSSQATTSAPQKDLIGDLLDLDLGGGGGAEPAAAVAATTAPVLDILGGGGGVPVAAPASSADLLGDILGLGSGGGGGAPAAAPGAMLGGVSLSGAFSPPRQTFLTSDKGKGLEISGTFQRSSGQIRMDMTFTNKSMGTLSGFAVQFNKNSFGLIPSEPLNVPAMNPGATANVSLPLATNGPVQRMEPLTNLQVAVKNNVDIFYFATLVPLHVFFAESGTMDQATFLATWKDIPDSNEFRGDVQDVIADSDTVVSKLSQSNAFHAGKLQELGHEVLLHSVKFSNNAWALIKLAMSSGSPNVAVTIKTRAPDLMQDLLQILSTILQS